MNHTAKHKTAEEAVKIVKSGDKIYLHDSAAMPHTLILALGARAQELKNVEIISISTLGDMCLA